MKILALVGSPSRLPAIDHLRSCGFEIKAISPSEVRSRELLEILNRERPDVVISIGWQHLFSDEILNGPWLLLNSHPTVLPAYRGPNPWANMIENDERAAGVTVHKIDSGMDSGPILHQEIVPLTKFDTYLSLRKKILELEPGVIEHALTKLRNGNASFVTQDATRASTYPRRKPGDSEIDPSLPLIDLFDRIRACDPDRFPAYFFVEGQKVCIRMWRPDRPEGEPEGSL